MPKPLILAALSVLAVATQWLVVRFLPAVTDAPLAYRELAWLQVCAAASAALLFANVVAPRTPACRRGAFVHAFFVCLFLPVAGQALLFAPMLLAMLLPPGARDIDAALVPPPDFNPSLLSHVTYGAGARLRARLAHHDIDADDRMAAMIAMGSLSPRIAHGMLNTLLADPVEEVRLLAYGISSTNEHAITQRIRAVQERLDETSAPAQRAALDHDLAELHWELVYQNLVQGGMRTHTMEQVERHARAALSWHRDDASMWYLLGRCALLNERPDEAQVYLRRALDHRFPAQRLLPKLAEAAFLAGRYERIAPTLRPLDPGTLTSALHCAARYWTQ